MKNFFKSSIFTSILLFILGILLVFESEVTITTISYIIGAILIAAGVFALVRFFSRKENVSSGIGLDVLYGVVTIILGILIVTNPHAIAKILPIVLGIAIIISSSNKLQYAFTLKNNNNDLWKTTMIIAIVSTICGVVLLFNPFAGAVLIMKIVGIFIIIYSVLDFVSTVIIKKNVNEFKNVIDSQTTVEAEVVYEKNNSDLDENDDIEKTKKRKKKNNKKKSDNTQK